jgi:hypothetical protein
VYFFRERKGIFKVAEATEINTAASKKFRALETILASILVERGIGSTCGLTSGAALKKDVVEIVIHHPAHNRGCCRVSPKDRPSSRSSDECGEWGDGQMNHLETLDYLDLILRDIYYLLYYSSS